MNKPTVLEIPKRVTAAIITTVFLATQLLVPVAFSAQASANHNNPPGNNGTLKVQEKGEWFPSNSNDPHVCTFKFVIDGVDNNQSGNITVEGQSPTPGGTYLVVPISSNSNGDGVSAYVNDTPPVLTLANGKYKATLDNKFGTDPGNKAKSKVFWVKCDEKIAVPAQPAVNDPCGPNNATWVKPADTNIIDWQLYPSGNLYAVTKDGYVFDDGTTSHNYGKAPDSNTPCVQVISVPAKPAAQDPCGLNNAYWVKPANTYSVAWSIVEGHLIATAKPGFVFTGGAATHDYGLAQDSNAPCVVSVPPKPDVTDPCGPANATWNKPADTATVTWAIVNGRLIATATAGNIFTGGSSTKDFGLAWDSNKPCPTGKIRIKKELFPSSDSGLFDLNINGQAYATAVGDNGDTGYVSVPVGDYEVSETAANGNTKLSDYVTEYFCYKESYHHILPGFFNPMAQNQNQQFNWLPAYHGWGTSVDVEVKKNEKLTCTFVNKRIPKITIVKDAQPNSDQEFNFSTSAQGPDFTLVDNGTNDGQEQKSFKVFSYVPYYFKESKVDGWKLTDITCDGGKWTVKKGVLWVSANYGDDITCTFENTKLAKVTIVKDAQPDSSQSFLYTTNLTGNLSQFNLTDDGVDAAAAMKQFEDLMPGTYTVSEGAMIGWALTSVTCSDGTTYQMNDANLSLDVKPGDDVTCTFVNQPVGGRGGDVLGASTSVSAPAELANTGQAIWANLVIGLTIALAAIGLAVATRRQKQLG